MGIFDNLPTLDQTPRGGWRVKNPEPTRLEKRAADIRDERKEEAGWRKAVWKRDGGCCRWCHRSVEKCLDLKPTRGEVHHISGRVVKAIRWDARNGALLCATCHERLTGKVAEKHVIESRHTFTVDGVSYIDGSKRLKFTRVA
jgi:5-methylcytosine-specific restriction endonuclease McrA